MIYVLCVIGKNVNGHRNSSNQLTFDFDKIEAGSYSSVTKYIVDHFELKPTTKLIQGLEEIFQDFKLGDLVVGLEWDIWSGYIVCSKNRKSEVLSKNIAMFVNENISKF